MFGSARERAKSLSFRGIMFSIDYIIRMAERQPVKRYSVWPDDEKDGMRLQNLWATGGYSRGCNLLGAYNDSIP